MRKSNLIFLSIFLISFAFIIFLTPETSAQSAYGDEIKKEFYEISRSKVDREITQRDIFVDSIEIKNLRTTSIRVSISRSESLSEVLELETIGGVIDPQNSSEFNFKITGKGLGDYLGDITISGDINEKIPVNLTVTNKTLNPEFFMKVETNKKEFTFKENLEFKVDLTKAVNEDIRNVTFNYEMFFPETNESYFLGNETKDVIGSLEIEKRFEFPEELRQGYYILNVSSSFNNITYTSKSEFRLRKPFLSIELFGFLPVWLLILIIILFLIAIISFIVIRRIIERRKKYKMQLDEKTLPKKDERSLFLGKVAERKLPAYLDMDALTTHAVVAGATGGGKSISAQVIIEEVLNKNVAVIVFDPTAQWSGMLRKCDDKKMLSYYPKFNLKPTDAKAFPGNVRQIQNERQAIDIEKHINPGQIQIFTMNKLTPPQIDTFVATVIASIFKSDPKEHPNLRVMLVFDEVHRLLPKFGGSGKGFLQIERACREFRKWGFGVMLVSQVLSDFVGEIKANINTEVQMRTRDEADLNRLKTKYGEEFLQSLIKASVGVGMFVNPKYNRGKPYFINFRPILHNTRRLSDEVLEKYNKYGEKIDDLEYQIEQLEKEKVDVFDIKMELKLVKSKLMTGNFTVVDIYLEGIEPRVAKQWESIGKKPKKREIKLVELKEVEASLAAAQKDRAKWEKENKKEEREEKSEGEQKASDSKETKEATQKEEKPEEDKDKEPEKETPSEESNGQANKEESQAKEKVKKNETPEKPVKKTKKAVKKKTVKKK